MLNIRHWYNVRHPLIGMVHMMPLPGSPGFRPMGGRGWAAVVRQARRDAKQLAKAGMDGLILENFGDRPFYPGPVPSSTVAMMAAAAQRVRRAAPDLPLGINVLRNDGVAAMGIAAAVGASFIRVNVLCGARLTDQGIVQGIAHDLARLRVRLHTKVKILADVQVKHSTPLSEQTLEEEIADTLDRGLADGIIVSGTHTGGTTPVESLQAARRATDAPLLAGSGVTGQDMASIVRWADGSIVGSSLKPAGAISAPVDGELARKMVAARDKAVRNLP